MGNLPATTLPASVAARSSERETAQQVFLANNKENERGKEATSRHDDGNTSTHYSSTYSSVASSRKARRHDASSELQRGCAGPWSPARSHGRGSRYPEAISTRVRS